MRKAISLIFNKFLILFVLSLLINLFAKAQVNTKSFLSIQKFSAIGVSLQTQDFGFFEGNSSDTCNCFEGRPIFQRGNVSALVSYYKNVNKRFAYSIAAGLGYGRISKKLLPSTQSSEIWLNALKADIYYVMGNPVMPLQPYLYSGIHLNRNAGLNYASLPLGIGMRYIPKTAPFILNIQVGYGKGLSSELRNSVISSIGFHVNLGRKTVIDKKICDTITVHDTIVKEIKKETIVDQYKKPFLDLTTEYEKLQDRLKICDCNFTGLPAIRFKSIAATAIQADSLLGFVAQKLIENPVCKLRVIGFGDSSKKEIEDSKKHAQWVVNYLVNKYGISETRLELVYGQKGDQALVQFEGVAQK
jgi:hypothetical protein